MPAGRPNTVINDKLLDQLSAIPRTIITNTQIVDLLKSSGNNVSLSTLQRYIKKTHGINFDQFREKKASSWKSSLFAKMLDMALKGNPTMAIWLSKQYLGMTDKQEVANTIATESNLIVQYKKDE